VDRERRFGLLLDLVGREAEDGARLVIRVDSVDEDGLVPPLEETEKVRAVYASLDEVNALWDLALEMPYGVNADAVVALDEIADSYDYDI
jgi:hypothetical protein